MGSSHKTIDKTSSPRHLSELRRQASCVFLIRMHRLITSYLLLPTPIISKCDMHRDTLPLPFRPSVGRERRGARAWPAFRTALRRANRRPRTAAMVAMPRRVSQSGTRPFGSSKKRELKHLATTKSEFKSHYYIPTNPSPPARPDFWRWWVYTCIAVS